MRAFVCPGVLSYLGGKRLTSVSSNAAVIVGCRVYQEQWISPNKNYVEGISGS